MYALSLEFNGVKEGNTDAVDQCSLKIEYISKIRLAISSLSKDNVSLFPRESTSFRRSELLCILTFFMGL